MAGSLAGQVGFHLGKSAALNHLGLAIDLASLMGIAGLLWTTPGDAIRLPGWVSELFIFSVIVALQIAHATVGGWLRLVVAGLVLIAARMKNRSPWWASVIGWLPV